MKNKRWTNEEIKYLENFNNTVVNWGKIAKDLDRSQSTIKTKFYSLGYKALQPKNNSWTKEEIELLKQYGCEKTDIELSKILIRHPIKSIRDKRDNLNLKKEKSLLGTWMKKKNIFIEYGEYLKMYDAEMKYFTIIDKNIKPIIEDKYWSMNQGGYFQFCYKDNKIKHIYLHNIICGKNDNDKRVCDHINQKRYDNRKENLRLCTFADNSRNKGFNIGILEIQPNLYACTQKKGSNLCYTGSFKQCFEYKKNSLKNNHGEYSFLENYDIKKLIYNLYTTLSNEEQEEFFKLIINEGATNEPS